MVGTPRRAIMLRGSTRMRMRLPPVSRIGTSFSQVRSDSVVEHRGLRGDASAVTGSLPAVRRQVSRSMCLVGSAAASPRRAHL